jgi:hypothetical protein
MADLRKGIVARIFPRIGGTGTTGAETPVSPKRTH